MPERPQASDGPNLRDAVAQRVAQRSVVTGQIALLAVPSMVDEYATMLGTVFALVGRQFTPEQLAQFKSALEGRLANAYATSPRSRIVVSFNAADGENLHYTVALEALPLANEYDDWVSDREPHPFGAEPDARVWALANEAADRGSHHVLDVGAGTGRNALALARCGYLVDAVEVNGRLAGMIRVEAERESLNVRVIQRDVFSAQDDLRRDYQLIVLSGVVPDFRTTRQLRDLFELAANSLAPGGHLVFNVFLTHNGYVPDRAALQLSEHARSRIFTRHEMSAAAEHLPLALVSDDSVYEYERAHLTHAAWPPTPWYAGWVSGQGVFDVEREHCPIEMRWLVYRRKPN
nr:class I SAM-dependent methyltransferase [Mycolicibacterium sp. CBMA 234]